MPTLVSRIPTIALAMVMLGGGVGHGLPAVRWGGIFSAQETGPVTPGTFIAIAGGGYHSLGLRADGTLVGWGNNGSGQINVPEGIFSAIAAGGYHSLALRDVLTPEMAIRALRDDVNRLQGIAIRNALRVKLNAALAAPSGSRACQWLQAFINQARAQRGKLLGIAQADYLIAQARDIRLLLGCR